ncbi:MAG: HAMP domain-containing sensor histidine kinase [Pseudomonadota bacterium]
MAILSAKKRPSSLAARLSLGAAIWCSATLIITGLLLVELFRSHIESRIDSALEDELIHLVSLADFGGSGSVRIDGQLSGARFSKPFSGWVWQVRRGQEILAQSASLGPLAIGVSEVLSPPLEYIGDFTGPGGVASRGIARNIYLGDGSAPLIFAIARPRSEIDTALHEFGRTVLIALSVLGVGLVGAIFYLVRFGLRPLEELRQKVSAMRDGSQQKPTRWPRELEPVAVELDDLQEHIDRLIERARGQAADLAHAVKTPLSVLRQLSQTAEPQFADTLRKQTDRINACLDRYLSRSRAAGPQRRRVDVAECVDDLLFALGHELHAKSLDVHLTIQEGARFIGDESDLYEMIGNLLDNARKWAGSRIEVSASHDGKNLLIAIADDGPGVPLEKRNEIFSRGIRLDETELGHGLGLTIVREISGLYNGEVAIKDSALGGALVVLTLPGLIDHSAQRHLRSPEIDRRREFAK